MTVQGIYLCDFVRVFKCVPRCDFISGVSSGFRLCATVYMLRENFAGVLPGTARADVV